MGNQDPDWLGELRWRGYPRLDAVRDVASEIEAEDAAPPPRQPVRKESAGDARVEELARENESLRARLEALARLSGEFERRLAEAGTAYEGAVLEAESRLRDAAFERERLSGELGAAKDENARMIARDGAREADLRLERERRSDAEKAALAARRELTELAAEAERLRAEAAGHAGALLELRRQASSQNERLIQSKALSDEDVRLLRQELREFLAKFHRIQETFGEKP
jgi:hypothetical protein